MKNKLMLKKLAAFLLSSAVIVITSAISGISAFAAGIEVNSAEAMQSAVDSAGTDAATLTLTADITASSSIIIGEGQNITIDLSGFTLGRNLSSPEAKGSVIIVEGGSLTVKDSSQEHKGVITGGASDFGGGISCLKKQTIPSSLTLSGVTFKDNKAGSGGAVYADSGCTVTVSGCTFEGNSAEKGGAICLWDETLLEARYCRFTDNRTEEDGGAVYVEDAPADNKAILFESCVFRGNRADRDGGALFICDDGVALSNTEITKNSAKKRGGAAFVDSRYGITVRGLVIIKDNTCDDNKSMANLTLENGTFAEAKIMNAGLYRGSHIAIGTTASSGKTYLSNSDFSKYQTRYFTADEGKLEFSKYLVRYSLLTTSASIFGNGNLEVIICFGILSLVTIILIVVRKKKMSADAGKGGEEDDQD